MTLTPTRRPLLAWAPASAYMLLIWALSSMTLPFNFEDVPFRDKGVHFVEYGTLALLLAYALRATFGSWRTFRVFAAAVVSTTLWGVTDEVHQAFVPGRSSDVKDVMADALGALLGACAYCLVLLWQQMRSRTDSQRAR